MTSAPRYDLRHEVPWIPVRYLDGHREVLALQPLLEQAHLISEITGDPVVWAGLMRFLPSVTALIAREDPGADYDEWARGGIPESVIGGGLDKVAGMLWLIHPDTPFMQDARLVIPEGPLNSTEWLHLSWPSVSSKAWWGKPGDAMHRDAGSAARAAQGLVASWYFSPGIGGRAAGCYADAPDEGWRPRGTVTFNSHGLRVFWRGGNLAETLLANTMEAHVRHGARRGGRNMPLWALTGDSSPAAGPLTASTWTGSVYRLTHDWHSFTGVHTGGRRILGLDADPAQRKKQVKAAEADIWRSDPTIPRVPVVKAGEETGDVRPVRSLHPSASAVQWAAEWYAADERRAAARSMEPGLIEVAASDVFAIRLEGQRTSPEVAYMGRMQAVSDVAAPGSRGRLISLSNLVVTPIRKTLYVGLRKALGAEVAAPLHDALFASFCNRVEPVLDDIVHDTEFSRTHAIAFAQEAQIAFENFIAPYMTTNALAAGNGVEGIAGALAYIEGRVRTTIREVRP